MIAKAPWGYDVHHGPEVCVGCGWLQRLDGETRHAPGCRTAELEAAVAEMEEALRDAKDDEPFWMERADRALARLARLKGGEDAR